MSSIDRQSDMAGVVCCSGDLSFNEDIWLGLGSRTASYEMEYLQNGAVALHVFVKNFESKSSSVRT